MILCTLALSVCAAAGMLLRAIYQWPIELIYVFLGIAAVGQSLGGPSRSSLLPQIVPAEKFVISLLNDLRQSFQKANL